MNTQKYKARVEVLVQMVATVYVEAESLTDAIQAAAKIAPSEGYFEEDVQACEPYVYSITPLDARGEPIEDGCISLTSFPHKGLGQTAHGMGLEALNVDDMNI
jgi:hypothetical protein